MSELLELPIRITRDKVSFTGVGKRSYEGRPAFEEALFSTLDSLRLEGAAQEYGRTLFSATFTGDLEDGYRSARQEVEQARARWRVRLEIPEDEHDLHTLWWECLLDPDLGKPLATRGGTLVSRFLSRGGVGPPLESERLKVLAVIANPKDLGSGKWEAAQPLDEAIERGILEEALGELEGIVEYEILTQNASLGRIRKRLRDERFNVLHIVGHGAFVEESQKGVLLLEGEKDENASPEDDQRLGQLVDDLPALKLVVLAACQSATRSSVDPFVGLAPKMLYSGVDAVVAMQDVISQDMARMFSENFYRTLFTGASGMVDAAMTIARDDLYFAHPGGGWDWAIPVLFMRGPGQLFVPVSGERPPDSVGTQAPVPPEPENGAMAPVQPIRPADYKEMQRHSSPKTAALTSDQKTFLFNQIMNLASREEELDAELKVLCILLDLPSEELEGLPIERATALIVLSERNGMVDRLAEQLTARKAQKAAQEEEQTWGMLRELNRQTGLRGVAS